MTPRALLAPARLAGQSILRTQTDDRLVDLVAAGSEAAFEAIVARYRRPLMGYLRRLLADERAEDALQQTFVRAHAAIERGEPVRNLRGWLYRIAHNTSANLIRDNALPHEPLDEQLGGGERPDQVADRRQALNEVLSAVQALPLRQRDAIVLRELEGRTYEEIAGELGVTHGAVRALLNRARNTIRSSVTAVTPVGLPLRFAGPIAEAPVPARIAELCGGAALTKACAAVLVTGATVGGAAAVPHTDHKGAERRQASASAAAIPARPADVGAAPAVGASVPAAPVRLAGRTRSTRRGDPRPGDAREPASPREGPEDRAGPDRRADPRPEPASRREDQAPAAEQPAPVVTESADRSGPAAPPIETRDASPSPGPVR